MEAMSEAQSITQKGVTNSKENGMTAAIMTIFDIYNYGNRLQNYAVQYVLNQMQLETVTFVSDSERISQVQKIKYFLQKITKYHLPGSVPYWKYSLPKCLKFEGFNRRYIKVKRFQSIGRIDRGIDYFIVGSDQVWNPLWYDSESCKKDRYLLTFTEKRKKICFSPSFGLTELPEEWKPWFKEHLLGFENLSVRETAGAKIIKELTGQEAEVLIDPTLMLSKDEWMEIARQPVQIGSQKKYAFAFFLGGMSDTVKKDIVLLVQRHGYMILDVLDMSRPEYMSDPSEFLYLLANAEMILTDSFHGCVFSFIFDKPFWVYDRIEGMDMNSRMETFLRKFDLEGRKRNQAEAIDDFTVDYSKGKSILCIEREKVIAFLKKSMQGAQD